MTPPRSVAVCGSCATRDIFNARFNPEHRRWYTIGESSHQSSMLSLMSPPIEPDFPESDGLNKYNHETLVDDFTRSFLGRIAEAKPDYLLIDFSGDAWFGSVRLDDGRYFTDNKWKVRKTAYYRRLEAAGSLTRVNWRDDADAYFALWTESLARFAAFLDEHCPDTVVVVHRLRSINQVVLGDDDRPRDLAHRVGLEMIDVPEINRIRARFDEHAITTYGWESIDLRAERYTSHVDHPWGPFWVHYSFDYHPRVLAELHRLDLSRRTDPDTVDKIRAIADAGHQRLVNQDLFVRRVDAAQRKRLRALESRGPLEVLRTALQRRRRRR